MCILSLVRSSLLTALRRGSHRSSEAPWRKGRSASQPAREEWRCCGSTVIRQARPSSDSPSHVWPAPTVRNLPARPLEAQFLRQSNRCTATWRSTGTSVVSVTTEKMELAGLEPSDQRDYALAAPGERVWRVQGVVGTMNVPLMTSSRRERAGRARSLLVGALPGAQTRGARGAPQCWASSHVVSWLDAHA